METTIAILKWIGVFVAGLAATVVFNVISVAHSAGKMEATVERLREAVVQQEKLAGEQKHALDEQRRIIDNLDRELVRLRAVMAKP